MVWFGLVRVLYYTCVYMKYKQPHIFCGVSSKRFVSFDLCLFVKHRQRGTREQFALETGLFLFLLYMYFMALSVLPMMPALLPLCHFFLAVPMLLFSFFFIGVPFISLPIADVIHHTINRSLSFAH